MSLRIHPRDKATILQGSALAHTDLSDFMVRTAVQAAQDLINKSERIALSERDSLRILSLLKNPLALNAKQLAAINVLPSLS